MYITEGMYLIREESVSEHSAILFIHKIIKDAQASKQIIVDSYLFSSFFRVQTLLGNR